MPTESRSAISEHGQQLIINPDFAEGQSTSLHKGIAAIGEAAAGAIVLLGDQPQVTPQIIDRLVTAFHASGSDIVQPVYSGTPGNPVIFRRTVFPELLKITGDRGARDVIQQKRDAVLRVPFPNNRSHLMSIRTRTTLGFRPPGQTARKALRRPSCPELDRMRAPCSPGQHHYGQC